jgi:hypothetical protein
MQECVDIIKHDGGAPALSRIRLES